MICDPSIKGKVIKHVESFRNGKARLAFTVPRTAQHQLLKVKLTIRLGDPGRILASTRTTSLAHTALDGVSTPQFDYHWYYRGPFDIVGWATSNLPGQPPLEV
jgi:hypothetical protein